MRQPHVEILYFEGCPNHKPTRELVERIAAELQVEPRIDLVRVTDAGAAAELRFLGSPSVRVDGHDVEPGADERQTFVLSCRVYRSEHGLLGRPDAQWIREAPALAGR